jgi:hypothetical protein
MPTARLFAQIKDALANGDSVFLDLPHYVSLELYDPKWRAEFVHPTQEYVLHVYNRVPRDPTLDHPLVHSKLAVLERVASLAGAQHTQDSPYIAHQQCFRMLVRLLYDHLVHRVRFNGAYHGTWHWDAYTSRWNGRGAACSSTSCGPS